jgi:hypothetical protein
MPGMPQLHRLNRDVADKLLDEAERDPQSVYRGKFVGIANGQVAVVSEDWVEVSRQLRQMEPNADKTYFLEIGSDGRQVCMIGPLPRPCQAPSRNATPVLNAVQQLKPTTLAWRPTASFGLAELDASLP